MWWGIGVALLIAGIVIFWVGVYGSNFEAPQTSDWGNRFIWPGVFTAAFGIGILLWQLFWFVEGRL